MLLLIYVLWLSFFFSIIISNKTKYYCNRNFSIENIYKNVDNRQHMLFYLYKYSMDH